MRFNLADDLTEPLDFAAEQPAKLTGLKTLFEAWSAEVDGDCRRLGIEPKMPKSPTPAKASATSARLKRFHPS